MHVDIEMFISVKRPWDMQQFGVIMSDRKADIVILDGDNDSDDSSLCMSRKMEEHARFIA